MEFILGLMVIDIRDNLRIVSNMEKEFKNSLMVIHIRACIKLASHQGMDSIIGLQVAFLKGNLKQV